MTRRLGILTGGGDSASLNAVIRAVTTRAILGYGWEVMGVEHGFRGVVERRAQRLDLARVRELLPRGGTILGASNRSNPFRYPVRIEGRIEARDVSDQALAGLAALGLSDLIAVGGDGTMEIAFRLVERGARIVGIPKTIDNDLAATDTTCGYQTAVAVATDALDRLRTTAESHDRIMICEVMGRNAGWIALEAGLAGGADAILLPELPYRVERVAELCAGRASTLVVMAEGARSTGGERSVVRAGDATRPEKLGGAADGLAGKLAVLLPELDTRVTVLGHVQRGGAPSAFDRVLATRYGVAAVDVVAAGETGVVVVQRGRRIAAVPMHEVCRGTKLVDPDGDLVHTARALGIVLGD